MQRATRNRFRDLSIGLSAMVVSILTMSTVVWCCMDRMQSANTLVSEACHEVTWTDALLDSVNDQRLALNALTDGDARFLGPYLTSRARMDRAFAQLMRHAADDPADLRAEVAGVDRQAQAWTAKVAGPVAIAAHGGRMPAVVPDADGARIAGLIEHLKTGQAQLLRTRRDARTADYALSRQLLVLGSVLTALFAGLIVGNAFRRLIEERRLVDQAAEKLARALDGAQAAHAAKARFLANVSHEMLTPLNGVVGMAEALGHTPLNPRQREMVDTIGVSAFSLNHVIGNLLSLAREEGWSQGSAVHTRFNLAAEVRLAACPYASEADARGVAFDIVDQDANLSVLGDASSLGRLIACLTSNAVKFTQAGSVELSVRAAGEGRFAFVVRDTGEGFDEEVKARLFEPFNRAHEGDTRCHGGAGLGLAVARRLAQSLGGTLEAHSAPGQGSTFSFEIPLAAAVDDKAKPTAIAEVPKAQAPRILIVDDNATNRRVLELILEQVGAECVCVGDGKQALEAVGQQAFAAILMDIQMPVMDGLTATREIRRLEREGGRPPTPLVVVSANCDPDQVVTSHAAGAQRHLGKPISALSLIQAIEEATEEVHRAAA